MALECHNFPDFACTDQTPGHHMSGMITVLEVKTQLDLLFVTCLDHTFAIGFGQGHRLLAQDVFPRLGRLQGVLGVEAVRCGHKQNVEFGVLQHLRQ